MRKQEKIAIIGAHVAVPQAADLASFMDIVLNNRETLTEVASPAMQPYEAGTVTRRPMLDGIDQFDGGYFGVNANDAMLMDPQHRLFLQGCRSLLYKCGIDYRREPRTGIFASCDDSQYERHILEAHRGNPAEAYARYIGSDRDFLATRVAYLLGLTGPALTVQTACSSSLVAVHLAINALLNDECDACLAGGSALQLPQGKPYRYLRDMIYSIDGSCRPFDVNASGTNLASGLGIVLLKRYADAVEQDDRIIAVICGSAINNDGRRKMSMTSPSPAGQTEVIAAALARADIDVAQLRFVETHGTATKLGDPVEFSALTTALSRFTPRKNFCALTGVKANFGHLSYAAGVVGLIKAALCLERKVTPGMTNFTEPSKMIRLEGSPFTISATPEPFAEDQAAALVSSLGIGGTNACVVLERFNAPLLAYEAPRRPAVIPLSDDKEGHLVRNIAAMASAIDAGTLSAPDAFSLASRLVGFGPYRAVIALAADGSIGAPIVSRSPRVAPSICFVFPGQGVQREGMYRSLYESNQVFRRHFDRCDRLFGSCLGVRPAELLWAQPDAGALDDTAYVQPILFSLQYALACTLAEYGVHAGGLVGHSLGEITALAVASAVSLETAVQLVVTRARCMSAAAEGRMLFVAGAGEAVLRGLLASGVSVAAHNGPTQFTLSGPAEAIEATAHNVESHGFRTTVLRGRIAAHSEAMSPVLGPLTVLCDTVRVETPVVPVYSTVTGARLIDTDWQDLSRHLFRHATQPVLFDDALKAACESNDIFLEIGDTFLCQHLLARGKDALPMLPRQCSDEDLALRHTLGALWTKGVAIDLAHFGERSRPASELPDFAFEAERVWPASDENAAQQSVQHASTDVEGTTMPDGSSATASVDDLLTVFRKVLKLPSIEADDDFFDLGGHSLLAIDLCEQIRLGTGRELAVIDVFQLRTPHKVWQKIAQPAHRGAAT